MPALKNAKREAFARHYCVDHNATQAAIRAGYSKRSANSIAYKLLQDPDIAERVSELDGAQLREVDITAERVKLELARVAFGDVRRLFDRNGHLVPTDQLDDDTAAGISGVDIEVQRELVKGKKDRTIETSTSKVRRFDKTVALRILAQHFRLVGSDAEEAVASIVNGLAERMAAARERQRAKR
jgi:phage terminase small subunit